MWIQWIEWIKSVEKHVNICKNMKNYIENMNYTGLKSIFVEGLAGKRISTAFYTKSVDNTVDIVDAYNPSRASPTITMSPAPMVINRSPFIQFSSK